MFVRILRVLPVALALLLSSMNCALAQGAVNASDEEQGIDTRILQMNKLQRQINDQKERITKIETQLSSLRRLPEVVERTERAFSTRASRLNLISPRDTQGWLAALLKFLQEVRPTEPEVQKKAFDFVSHPDQVRTNDSVRLIMSFTNISIDAALRIPRRGGPFDEEALLDSEEFTSLPDVLQQKIRAIVAEASEKTPSTTDGQSCTLAFNNLSPGDPDIIRRLDNNITWLKTCVTEIPVLHDRATKRAPVVGSALLKVKTEFTTFVDGLRSDKNDAESKLQKYGADLDALERKSVQQLRGKTLIDRSAQDVIYYTLWAWGLIITAVIVAILVLSYFSFARNPQQPSLIESQDLGGPTSYMMFLEMMTVFLLTGTILILGLSGRLNTETLAALIGGISGYVLGRMHSKQQRT